MMYNTENSRWRAVQRRDPAANNAFVYAVHTTRIFCRPTCPARLARRANVSFHNTPADAFTQGFRPCKRCKPADATSEEVKDKHERIVRKACDFINAYEGKPSLAEVAAHVELSSRYLHGVFKSTLGMTPAAYSDLRSAGGLPANSEPFISTPLEAQQIFSSVLEFGSPAGMAETLSVDGRIENHDILGAFPDSLLGSDFGGPRAMTAPFEFELFDESDSGLASPWDPTWRCEDVGLIHPNVFFSEHDEEWPATLDKQGLPPEVDEEWRILNDI